MPLSLLCTTLQTCCLVCVQVGFFSIRRWSHSTTFALACQSLTLTLVVLVADIFRPRFLNPFFHLRFCPPVTSSRYLSRLLSVRALPPDPLILPAVCSSFLELSNGTQACSKLASTCDVRARWKQKAAPSSPVVYLLWHLKCI